MEGVEGTKIPYYSRILAPLSTPLLDYIHQTSYFTPYLTPYFKLHSTNSVIYSVKQYFTRPYTRLQEYTRSQTSPNGEEEEASHHRHLVCARRAPVVRPAAVGGGLAAISLCSAMATSGATPSAGRTLGPLPLQLLVPPRLCQ
jgi:hypothetical protein